MRGFDIRGVGPRVIRYAATYDPLNPVIDTSNDNRGQIDDALGGRAYYQGRIELDIPLGTGAKELGLRPSIFLDVGSVFSVRRPTLTTLANFRETDPNAPGFGLTKSLCRNATTGESQFATETTTTTGGVTTGRSEEHTSELQSLMRI